MSSTAVRQARAVVVVPTYDEAESIGRQIETVLSLVVPEGVELDVLVVDDSSPDGTGAVVSEYATRDPRVRLLTRTSKDGLGAAYREGFRAALRDGYDVIVQMDADGSHPAAALPEMLARLRLIGGGGGDADVVIGSRYVAGGATRGWPYRRRALSRLANGYARTVLGLRTRDATAGFRAWTADAVREAGVLETASSGYGFQVENTWHAERAGLRVLEHPITFTDRTHGTSKMSACTALEALWLIARWRATGVRTGLLLAAIVALSVLARLPFLARPLTPDEGGFLMVAGQWSPGTSLYGDYWVDRPPLLVGIFQLADLLGGAPTALRVVGLVWVTGSVLLAASLGRAAAPQVHRGPVAAAATAAVFLVTPMFGATTVNGELLAVPFVLGGLVAVLRAWSLACDLSEEVDHGEPNGQRYGRRKGRWVLGWWAVAGGCGVAAAAVKQNMLGVLGVVVVSALVLALRGHLGRAARALGAAGAGGATTGALLLGWAAARGTSLTGLWDAVVVFRFDATAVIAASASATTPDRAAAIALAFLASGAAAVLVAAVATRVIATGARGDQDRIHDVSRRGAPLGVLTLVLILWEVWGVVAGGSYWHHYLIGLVPGLVLAVAWMIRTRTDRRIVLLPLVYAAGATSVAVAVAAATGPASVDRVADYVSAHAGPGDTAVTAFGDPAILREAGLSSPYEHLWSLPVRVRDPQLVEFTGLLRSAGAPTWVVLSGTSLDTWGVDATRADRVLRRRYRAVTALDDWTVFQLREPARTRGGSGASQVVVSQSSPALDQKELR